MKFLIDAQLPRRLAVWLRSAGYEVVHTLELPAGNRTQDHDINALSVAEQWIVITKDKDFVNSFLVAGKPYKLLLVATGNISNTDLEKLFLSHFDALAQLLESHRFVELNRATIVVHT